MDMVGIMGVAQTLISGVGLVARSQQLEPLGETVTPGGQELHSIVVLNPLDPTVIVK